MQTSKQVFKKAEDLIIDYSSSSDKYTALLKCSNCKRDQWHHNIPKGMRAETYLKGTKCIFCNCDLIKEKEDIIY